MTETIEETALADTLIRLSHVVQYVFADVNREYDLTPQQAQFLCMLIRGPVGMTELSRLLHVEKSSLTGLVDRVERRGLVARVRGSHDRRACQIALTDEGMRLALESHQHVTARLESLAGDLSSADRRRLASVIAQLITKHDASTHLY